VAIIAGTIKISETEFYTIPDMSKELGTDKEITDRIKIEADLALKDTNIGAYFHIFSKVPYAYAIRLSPKGVKPEAEWWNTPEVLNGEI
jgi:hypothetical protein